MKNKIRVFSILILLVLLPGFAAIEAKAEVPYVTYTLGPKGYVVPSQTAYLPEKVIQAGFKKPEDLFVDKNDVIYVCDTGNKRIVRIKPDGTYDEISGAPMQKPTGIYVTDHYIYVADYGAQKILIYDKDGSLVKEIGRPNEPIFGAKTKFVPMKLTVDLRGNIYVVSEGSTSGIMQMNEAGEFLGYFGSNQTYTTLKIILQRTLFTEEQLNKLLKNIPPSVTNVTIDSQGLLYTVTKGQSGSKSIRKLSISGLDLFNSNYWSDKFTDITVDANGNVYAIDDGGMIFEYDSYGNMIFAFGEKDNDMDRMGTLTAPVSIDIMSNGSLIVLDKGKNLIQVLKPTDFANTVHKGINYYKAGLYVESEDIWKSILKMNSSFVLSYDALGKASYKKQDYDAALYNYQLAENKSGYSQAFWEYRNQWLQSNLSWVIIGLILFLIACKVVKSLDRRNGILDGPREVGTRIKNIPIISKITYAGFMLRHPIDGYYYLKRENRGDVVSASILYIWLFVLQITNMYVVGYIFNNKNPQWTSMTREIINVALPIFLWVICNYLISTITDGEGKLRHVYTATAYALAPYLIFALPLQFLSNILTENEGFVYYYGKNALIAWSAVMIFLMVMEIHNFSFKQTVKNILVTICTIILFVLIAIIMYLLFRQMKDFIISILKEVELRG